jgi:streptogramin lyase
MTVTRATAFACLIAATVAVAAAAPTDIVINDSAVFPESIDSVADGTIYIGGSNSGVIYRVAPGQARAEPWISKSQGDFHFVLGVLAQPATNTLWVCDNVLADKVGTLKSFALDSGKRGKDYPFPEGGVCNDISLKDGAAYITDTLKGRILRLSPGASGLTVWYSQPDDPSLDGLVWARDGNLYTNTYFTNHLIRIGVNKDGSAGKGTVLTTSLPLFQPDAMRLTADGRLLLVEGQGRPGAGLKDGRLDEVTVRGDAATIAVLKSGFELPVGVTAVGNTAWVLESKFDYQRNEDLKGKDPGSFHAYVVPLPRKPGKP